MFQQYIPVITILHFYKIIFHIHSIFSIKNEMFSKMETTLSQLFYLSHFILSSLTHKTKLYKISCRKINTYANGTEGVNCITPSGPQRVWTIFFFVHLWKVMNFLVLKNPNNILPLHIILITIYTITINNLYHYTNVDPTLY